MLDRSSIPRELRVARTQPDLGPVERVRLVGWADRLAWYGVLGLETGVQGKGTGMEGKKRENAEKA